jgi:hypothetical protein
MKKIDAKTISGLKRFMQAVIVIVVGIVIMKVDWKLRGPEAIHHENKLIIELDELQPLPNALLMSQSSSVNPDVGIVKRSYAVQGVPASSIEHWYKEEFGRLTWSPLSVESHLSKRPLRFCRNGETATLWLPEDSSGTKTEFQVEIGWGSSFSC